MRTDNHSTVARRPLVWVEGLIAAGKSVFCREVGDLLGWLVLHEPVEENPYLEDFYSEPPASFKRWAWPMQIELLARRFATQKLAATVSVGAGPRPGVMLDRSISGDRVFCKLHRKAGNISYREWETYERFYMIMAETLQPPTHIVYLDCKPETALERAKMRARGAEVTLTLDYLKQLDEGYSELWEEARRGLMPWGHAVTVSTFHWDPIADTMPDWERHAERLRDMCLHRR